MDAGWVSWAEICRAGRASSFSQANGDGLGVGGEALGIGEGHRGGADIGERGTVERDPGGALEEIIYRQARGEAGGAGGGQDMVGAGDVVANGLRAVGAQENGAGMADIGEDSFRILQHELQMFGCDAVGEADGLRPVLHQDDGAVLVPAGAGDVAAGQSGQRLIDRGGDGGGEIRHRR